MTAKKALEIYDNARFGPILGVSDEGGCGGDHCVCRLQVGQGAGHRAGRRRPVRGFDHRRRTAGQCRRGSDRPASTG